jgi:hypothetical protein
MHCPIHHIHAVELVADDASAALVGRLFDTELLVGTRLQVIQHQEHAHKEGAGATGGVADGERAQGIVEAGPEVVCGQGCIGALFFVGVGGEDDVVEQRAEFGAQPVAERIHQRQAAHQVDFHPWGVEDAGSPTQVLLGQPLRGDVDQALVDLAEHFGVNSDLYIEGGRLGDREVVAFEEAWCAAVEAVKELFEELVGRIHRIRCVELVFAKETTIEEGRKLERPANVFGEVAMPAVELVVEGFKEEHPQPLAEEGVTGLPRAFVAFPEVAEEVGIPAEPAFALDEVEEHQAVQELQCVVVRPGFSLRGTLLRGKCIEQSLP